MDNPDTFDPFASPAPAIVYVDIKSPYAFIAKDPTRALERELGLQFDWRPLTLNIPSYLGSAKLDKKGKVAAANRTPQQWSGVKYAYRDARRYAKMQGYTLRGTEKIWDTSLVHIGMQWTKRSGHAATARYLDLVYEPFWRRALDVESISAVTAMLEAAQVSSDGFADYANGPGRQFHDQTQLQIFAAGIFGVPAYVVGEQWFFGREHLPTVSW
ncbi:MAG: DsbA family protein, partial [Pseudomonadales bacterium]